MNRWTWAGWLCAVLLLAIGFFFQAHETRQYKQLTEFWETAHDTCQEYGDSKPHGSPDSGLGLLYEDNELHIVIRGEALYTFRFKSEEEFLRAEKAMVALLGECQKWSK